MDDAAVLTSLRKLGNGDAHAGLRALCAMAFTCSVCLQRYSADSKCACSGEVRGG